MRLGEKIICGITDLDEESIEFVKEKIDEVADFGENTDEIILTVIGMDIQNEYLERTVYNPETLDDIMEELKDMYSKVNFYPFAISVGCSWDQKKSTVN